MLFTDDLQIWEGEKRLLVINISVHRFGLHWYVPNLRIRHVCIYVGARRRRRRKKTKYEYLISKTNLTSCINKHDTFISNWAAPGRPWIGVNVLNNDCGSAVSYICDWSLEQKKVSYTKRKSIDLLWENAVWCKTSIGYIGSRNSAIEETMLCNWCIRLKWNCCMWRWEDACVD